MMKDFKRLWDECFNEVVAAGILPGHIVEWKINTRARARMNAKRSSFMRFCINVKIV